jgi:hypothetical protein
MQKSGFSLAKINSLQQIEALIYPEADGNLKLKYLINQLLILYY